MPTAGPSLSDKAKQRLVHSGEATTLDRPGPSRSRRPKPAETAKEIDGDEDQGDAEAPKQTGKRKGNSGPKRRMEERDRTQQASQGAESSDAKQEPEDRPVKRAKANPPTDAPSNVMACPRCVKQGRPCINEPGRACAQCRKSKVKCPLFNGQRGKSRAPTEAPTAGTSSAAGRPPSPPTSGRHLPRMVPSSWARAPTPATPAQQPAPAGKKPKPTASRTSGMSTICYIRTSLKTPTKAPPW